MKNKNYRRWEDYFIAGIFMSLAWSLRGQFGHLKGGLIPGAVAALIPLMLLRGSWLSSTGLALALSSLGFSLGGHMSYGRLVEFVQLSDLSRCLPQILKIFLIGGVWGGLGATFLGFGLSEKPFSRRDFLVIFGVWIFWLLTLGIFNLDSLDILILFAGFTALQFYNWRWKKSKNVFDYGFGCFLGFGSAFLFAILLLNFGRRGWIPGAWKWWGLRDQIIGFLAGLVIWAITERCHRNKTFPALDNDAVSMHKIGIIFIAIMIPAVNTLNVVTYWLSHKPFSHPEILSLAAVSIFFAVLFFVFLNRWEIFSIHLERTLLCVTIFFMWYMSFIAISKEMVIWGLRSYETAYFLFVFYSAILTRTFLVRRNLPLAK